MKRLTSTLNDEFSPRASPDGKKILFVSNYLGNLDLFLTNREITPAIELRNNFESDSTLSGCDARKTVGLP